MLASDPVSVAIIANVYLLEVSLDLDPQLLKLHLLCIKAADYHRMLGWGTASRTWLHIDVYERGNREVTLNSDL